MTHASCRCLLSFLLVLGWLAAPAAAAPISSKVATAPVVDRHEADRAAIESFLARDDVARALAAHGLSPEEAEMRLARLSDADLATLTAHIDQVQAAGDVPNYIWVLLAILIGVTIVTTVF